MSIFEEIVGDSPALQAVIARVSKVAPTDCTVLVTGETGTGKELIARAIHKRSRRSACAFVTVNCGALSAALVESDCLVTSKVRSPARSPIVTGVSRLPTAARSFWTR